MESQDTAGCEVAQDGDIDHRKARLLEGLKSVVPESALTSPNGSAMLSDSIYTLVTGWCESNNFFEWGKRPRTLMLLYMIGCAEAIEGFVNEGLSDIALPYSEENLPRVIKGLKRTQLIANQHRVLSSQAADLERAGGPHCHIDGNADVHFYLHRELGSGGFGTVDHVYSRLSLRPFARKRIPRGRSFKKDQAAVRMFENELATLKALSHRHLRYLAASEEVFPDRSIHLRRFVGCLAAAVEYLHQHKVRHKDIKPQNILVKQGRVFLTDFGTSRSWANDSHGTTTGTNRHAFTKAYCAPEVAAHETRNTSADIWSLGCVYLEICTALHGNTVPEMRTFFSRKGTKGLYVRDNPQGAHLWMDHLRELSPGSDDHQVLELVTDMCDFKHDSRPSATEILSLILDFEGSMYYDFCCDRTEDDITVGDPDLTTMVHRTHLRLPNGEGVEGGDIQSVPGPFAAAAIMAVESSDHALGSHRPNINHPSDSIISASTRSLEQAHSDVLKQMSAQVLETQPQIESGPSLALSDGRQQVFTPARRVSPSQVPAEADGPSTPSSNVLPSPAAATEFSAAESSSVSQTDDSKTVQDPQSLKLTESISHSPSASSAWSNLDPPFYVVALHDYDSNDPTDLSFREGDNIWITQKQAYGLWYGAINGVGGCVPSNFCKPWKYTGYDSDTVTGPDLVSGSIQPVSYPSADKGSDRPRASQDSVNNPKLLSTVEEVMQRLVGSELKELKRNSSLDPNDDYLQAVCLEIVSIYAGEDRQGIRRSHLEKAPRPQ